MVNDSRWHLQGGGRHRRHLKKRQSTEPAACRFRLTTKNPGSRWRDLQGLIMENGSQPTPCLSPPRSFCFFQGWDFSGVWLGGIPVMRINAKQESPRPGWEWLQSSRDAHPVKSKVARTRRMSILLDIVSLKPPTGVVVSGPLNPRRAACRFRLTGYLPRRGSIPRTPCRKN